MPDTETTIVVFRKWHDDGYIGDGIIALFPELTDEIGKVLSYEHVGQHGDASYNHVIYNSRAATPEEYAALKRELESPPYGYKLAVRKRRPGRQH